MIAIQTKNLTKKFEEQIAVDSLNLSIEQGELFTLLGVNGAGKTTTIKMLTCLSTPTTGDASILGNSIVSNPYAVKEQINVSPQETAVAPNLSVKENLELIAQIYGFHKTTIDIKVEEMLRTFSLTEVSKMKAKTLSGGMQRRLSIAMALITDPKILFLDEPTLGLDVIARRELWSAIEKLKGSMTIILTTHYMEEAEALSDRIGTMAKGKLKAVGTAAELKESTNTKSLEEAFVSIATKEEVVR
ncbi:ABC transporter ATP-binding protein [Bacillus safensis]|uniref:ABC transporter ATP-binding protein n=1 Tax=Bacillus TaxID=1386 RepID=UPI000877834F|nr:MULTISPECIES: ABC transporter A family member [Bacillus]MBK4213721.1 ATP-binding cassette domain-containing protein [Bacillus pumilus]MBT2260889.1 ATP-binding cassette domain-containing protein [Bacillus safensis]MDH6564181.1 ABC-2 type transport system ATP-binding protein [Bacillus sp. TBS-096]MEC2426144.1 ABC transporter A family member [Bacillus safensis]MED0802343.1 ABC transporter A family member [Bacillus safensis]